MRREEMNTSIFRQPPLGPALGMQQIMECTLLVFKRVLYATYSRYFEKMLYSAYKNATWGIPRDVFGTNCFCSHAVLRKLCAKTEFFAIQTPENKTPQGNQTNLTSHCEFAQPVFVPPQSLVIIKSLSPPGVISSDVSNH